jgi:glycosyltransferase involved in cell wall biosynthesis
MSEHPRVLQMGPDPALGGGMAAAMRGLLDSPLVQRYRLDVVPTYRGARPLPRLAVFCGGLARLVVWALAGRGRIVHVHVTVRGSAYRKALCALVARALRRRVILHVHAGPGDIAAFRGRLGRPRLALLRAGLAAADSVLAVSEASAEALRRAGVTGPIGVVPNLLPPIPDLDRSWPQEGEVEAVYLGGFANPAKGGDVLVAALPLALLREPRLRLVLAGPGEPPAEAAALIAAEPALSWAGWLDDEAKDRLLRRAQVFVMPSRSEGLPMALMEAMAYGMAIAATDVGGIPEAVADDSEGLLVASEQPQELSEAICRLAADPALRRRLGEAARARAERLDDVAVVDRLDALYRSLG